MNLNFKKLSCESLKELKPYFAIRPTMCCESHMAYHMIWRHYYETEYYADEKGILWIQKIDDKERASILPVSDIKNMKENFDRLQAYYSDVLGEKMHMYVVDQEALEAISPDPEKYEIIEDVDSYDYIYDGEALRTLAGQKMHKKKNRVLKFLREYGENAEFVRLKETDKEEMLQFLNDWFEQKDSDDEFNRLESEEKGILDLIQNTTVVDTVMAGIRLDGKLKALTMASYDPVKDMVDVHIEKADPKITGLSNYIGMKFLQECFPTACFVNREDDMGIPGLRRAKESLHPIMRGVKYTIIEK